MREGHVDEAVREFEHAIAQDPSTRNARANLGQIRYDQGAELLEARRFGAAADVFKVALDLLPDSAEAENDLGVSLASMGRIGEAVPHFRKAVALQPDFAEARRNLESAEKASAGGR
jgi:tetratricopeptide (TPR) repeat protein